MISRVADECFWMGRYLERAESTSRVLASARTLALEAGHAAQRRWRDLLSFTGEEAAFVERHGAAALSDGEAIERALTWDEESPGCLARSVRAARENARSARDLLTPEVWEALNDLYLWLGSSEAKNEYAFHRFGFYSRLCASTQTVLGWTRSTMLQDAAVDFLWLGVTLERAGWTARLLDAHGRELDGGPRGEEAATWNALLGSCAGLEPYLRRARGQLSPRAVAGFLLLDAAFPRSVLSAVRTARDRLSAIHQGVDPALRIPKGEASEDGRFSRTRSSEGGTEEDGRLLRQARVRSPTPPPAGAILEQALPGVLSLDRLSALDAWLSGLRIEALDAGVYRRALRRVAREADAVSDALAGELLGPRPDTPPAAAPEG